MTQPEQRVDELKPCPFCGGEDTFVERADFSSCYVICNDCGARGPASCDENDADAEATEIGEAEPGEMAARRRWASRPAPPAAQPEGEFVRVPDVSREVLDALKPFADLADYIDSDRPDFANPAMEVQIENWPYTICVSWLYAARTALSTPLPERTDAQKVGPLVARAQIEIGRMCRAEPDLRLDSLSDDEVRRILRAALGTGSGEG